MKATKARATLLRVSILNAVLPCVYFGLAYIYVINATI